ncbi:MAG TPA: CBS domain-containing protein [Clostridia bacterium]|nr:CBS domain-containing protein [Clostridia bacterium]
MKRAKDIMTSPVVTVRADQTVREAARIMADKHFSGLPVVDEEGNLVGIVTEADLLERSQRLSVYAVRKTWSWVSPYFDLNDLVSFRQGLDHLAGLKISDVMSRKVVTVEEDTPLEEIASLMVKHNVNRVPVLDKQGNLAGIVTRADIVKAVANG